MLTFGIAVLSAGASRLRRRRRLHALSRRVPNSVYGWLARPPRLGATRQRLLRRDTPASWYASRTSGQAARSTQPVRALTLTVPPAEGTRTCCALGAVAMRAR